MAKLRTLILLTVVASVAIAAAGWFLLVSPKKAEATDLQSQADKETSSQATLQQQVAMLMQDERHSSQYQAALGRLKVHMPDSAEEPSFIRELYKAADAAAVDLHDVTPGTPTAVTGQAVAAPAPTTTTSATPTDSASASPTSDRPAPPVVVPAALESVIPITVTMSGTYAQVKDFLSRTNNFRRAFLVNGINLTIAAKVSSGASAGAVPAGGSVSDYSGKLTAVITGSIFAAGAPGAIGLNEMPLSGKAQPTVSPTAPVSGRKK